jgi:hypothetical protein
MISPSVESATLRGHAITSPQSLSSRAAWFYDTHLNPLIDIFASRAPIAADTKSSNLAGAQQPMHLSNLHVLTQVFNSHDLSGSRTTEDWIGIADKFLKVTLTVAPESGGEGVVPEHREIEGEVIAPPNQVRLSHGAGDWLPHKPISVSC